MYFGSGDVQRLYLAFHRADADTASADHSAVFTTERAAVARRYGVRIHPAAGTELCRRAAPAASTAAPAAIPASAPATTEALSLAEQIRARLRRRELSQRRETFSNGRSSRAARRES